MTSDPDRGVLYDEEGFETLISYFTGLHSPDLGDLSVESDCPQCGDRLKLIEPTLNHSNGAFATASCTCG
jgi:hypothetical protein